MRIRDFIPRSLYTRFLLIIILPTLVAQLFAVYIFYERHWSSVTRNLALTLSGEVVYAIQKIKDAPAVEYDKIFYDLQEHLGLYIALYGDDSEFKHHLPGLYEDFEDHLRKRVDLPVKYTYDPADERISVRVELANNTIYIEAPRKRLANPSSYIFLIWMTSIAALLTFVALLFLRGQVRSIIRLTEAADKFGKGQDMPDFKPQGAREIRNAAIAFIEMRERIKRLITRRTLMLASISHDLRTPITRMKLQVEMLRDKKAKASLKQDLEEMEYMVEEYLDFTRTESGEPAVEVQLNDFFQDIVREYDNSTVAIALEVEDDLIIEAQAHALKRCVVNIINNSQRFAKHLLIEVYRSDPGMITMHFDDDGPSIPEAEREHVFQPFYRVETSRNNQTGGIGLGLAITRDIIHRHGGEISLTDSPKGGLRVTVHLPE